MVFNQMKKGFFIKVEAALLTRCQKYLVELTQVMIIDAEFVANATEKCAVHQVFGLEVG